MTSPTLTAEQLSLSLDMETLVGSFDSLFHFLDECKARHTDADYQRILALCEQCIDDAEETLDEEYFDREAWAPPATPAVQTQEN